MRIRCTRGLAIHTFHGNFFVRSTDLLSLPNVNPDAGFGMQVTIEETLSDISTVCFQAAVLYTSSKSERRIRIHTYCLPVTKSLNELVNGADQEAIVGLVAKMGKYFWLKNKNFILEINNKLIFCDSCRPYGNAFVEGSQRSVGKCCNRLLTGVCATSRFN